MNTESSQQAVQKLFFSGLLRDPGKMAALYEEFIRNFYAIRALQWREGRRSFPWQMVQGTEADLALLSTLNTDVTLVRGRHIFILDAKYYRDAVKHYQGADRVAPSNINQLFAYMCNMAICEPAAETIEGALVYPAVDRNLDATFRLHGHRVQVRTVDLSKPWRQIESRLLSFLPV